MVSSADGASSIARCIAHAQAKDRKKFVRVLKGHAVNLLFHDFGYIVLTALISMIDDTVLINKSILTEIMSEEVANDFINLLINTETRDLNSKTKIKTNDARSVFCQILDRI
jgi:adenylylsulfate kinase-like enzyme